MKQMQEEAYYDRALEIEAYWLKGVVRKFPQHCHGYYMMWVGESGWRNIGGMTYEAGAGDVALFNLWASHCAG